MRYNYSSSFKAFSGILLTWHLETNDSAIESKIDNETEDYILNVNEKEYKNHIISEFSLKKVIIHFKKVFVSDYEKDIPAEDFPDEYDVIPGKSFKRSVVVYHIPFNGDINLIKFKPSHSTITWLPKFFIKDNNICFEIIAFNRDTKIKQQANEIINNLKIQLDSLNKEIDEYNTNLPKKIEQIFSSRKKRLLDKNKMLASLDVPIKKKEYLPKTYSIPISPTQKIVIKKPKVTEIGFEPEPTLDQSIYHDVLKTIFAVGQVFERLPSTYSDKNEEQLRDNLLLYLEPRYEYSATGETFNKKGKTDILIRCEKSNVFIAECKFWRGQRYYLNSISQLLKYLTWRDSKAAVVLFVDRKNFSAVLKTIKDVTPYHKNYLGFVNKEEETWFNYRFHIINNPNREVKLAILAFHIPIL